MVLAVPALHNCPYKNSSKNLSGKCSSRVKFRHKDIPLDDRGTRINHTEIIEASLSILEAERDWGCAFCHKFLPAFGNYREKQKNVCHRYNTSHPRRDTSNSAAQKARQRKAKENPAPNMSAAA